MGSGIIRALGNGFISLETFHLSEERGLRRGLLCRTPRERRVCGGSWWQAGLAA